MATRDKNYKHRVNPTGTTSDSIHAAQTPPPETPPHNPHTHHSSQRTLINERYEILALIGTGGMGNVYKVFDHALNEVVALKTLHQELHEDSFALSLFRREVKLARRVTHPNIARTYDLSHTHGSPFLTMEYIKGQSLSTVTRDTLPWPAHRLLPIITPICEGLSAAHRAGVIHRDLKPSNILISPKGRVVLTDFGVARLIQPDAQQEGAYTGTPAFMAPEQVHSEDPKDHRVDIYALGVMLFELLSGELPWTGPTALAAALSRVLHPPPRLGPRDDLPDAVCDVVLKCMARDPDERYFDITQVATDFQKALEHDAQPLTLDATPRLNAATPSPHFAPGDNVLKVAVLPFEHDPSINEYVACGLMEELIDALSMRTALCVLPMDLTSNAAFKSMTALEAGKELDVNIVVKGNLRRIGDTMKMRLTALSVEDSFQLWGRRFKGDTEALLSICEEAATDIAAALMIRQQPARVDVSSNPEVIDLYMRARFSMRLNWYRGVDEAVKLFEQGIALAPDDGRMLSGAATARARAGVQSPSNHAHHLQLGEIYAKRAIAAAPQWPEPLHALAMVHYYSDHSIMALRSLERALALSATHQPSHELLGRILLETGPYDRALHHLKRANELAPQSQPCRLELARAMAFQGDWDSVEAIIADIPDNTESITVWTLLIVRLNLWRHSDAPLKVSPTLIFQLRQDGFIGQLIKTYRDVRKTGVLHPHQRDFLARSADNISSGPRLARSYRQFCVEIFLFAGDWHSALVNLQKSVTLGLLDRVWMERCPLLDAMRGDARFQTLLNVVKTLTDNLHTPAPVAARADLG